MDNHSELWPGWKTVRIIGQGSFGAVYEIERTMLGISEKAALKVITIPQNDSDIRELLNDGYDEETVTCTFKDYLVSIVSEYNLMRKLNGSSNIVSCDDYRYVQHDDGFGWDIFIKMELLTPLAEALPKEIPEEMALQIGIDICKALVLCAKYDIIHRDIKPQNIFVSPNGDYKLGDFGIAKTVEKTSGGTKVGTYKYMAPEVYNNKPYGASADIYSLGLVMYWLLNEKRLPFLPLTGRLNPKVDEEARTRRLQGEALPAPAHGSKELKRIVLKACAYDPKERYHTAEEMLKNLQHVNNPIPHLSGPKYSNMRQMPIRSDHLKAPEENRKRDKLERLAGVQQELIRSSTDIPQPALPKPKPEPRKDDTTSPEVSIDAVLEKLYLVDRNWRWCCTLIFEAVCVGVIWNSISRQEWDLGLVGFIILAVASCWRLRPRNRKHSNDKIMPGTPVGASLMKLYRSNRKWYLYWYLSVCICFLFMTISEPNSGIELKQVLLIATPIVGALYEYRNLKKPPVDILLAAQRLPEAYDHLFGISDRWLVGNMKSININLGDLGPTVMMGMLIFAAIISPVIVVPMAVVSAFKGDMDIHTAVGFALMAIPCIMWSIRLARVNKIYLQYMPLYNTSPDSYAKKIRSKSERT